MLTNKTLATIAALSLGAVATQAAGTIVYSNAVNYSGQFFNPGANEVGDEIILAGTNRRAESFRFEYYGDLFSGNEQFQLRFYNNTGPSGAPSTVFYDSGLLALAEPLDPSGRGTYLFDLTFGVFIMPNDFTWTVQFSGVTAGETAGLVIYDPPTVGGNYNDFWFRNGVNWELRTNNTPGAFNSFGASITAVPEPSTYVLAILGGLCGLALMHRRTRKA